MNDIGYILNYLKNYDGETVSIMEICGTHTAAIAENGIPSLLSDKIRLISGPGCPVCVTVSQYIDKLIELALQPGHCVVSFGDMLRVAGSKESLRSAQAHGANVRMVYSPFDAVEMAKAETDTEFIFAAVGFETTTPAYALMIDRAKKEKICNLKLLTALKTMPPVIDRLCISGMAPDGFIAPGHVSVITGSTAFEYAAKKYSKPFAVAGFDGESLVRAIYVLVRLKGTGTVKNLYTSAVTHDGNTAAQALVSKYFEPCDAAWRGLGIIENSGMVLREEYTDFDAGSAKLTSDLASNMSCRCGEVITGALSPVSCPLFGKSCTPDMPKGACMVSAEGSCFNYYVNKRQR